MKQIKHFLLTVAVLLCNISASAHDFEVGGIYYNIMSSADFTAEVTYRGGEYYESNEYSGSVTIPESVTYNGNAYRVSGIGTYAFRDCTGLTSIEIPNSVTDIGNQAFRNCSLLTSVTIPSSVANIGNQTFYQCSNLTSVEIPNSVTSIGVAVFRDCTSLTSIEIPNSVTDIGASSFRNCTSLTSIEIPNSVTRIGSSAFEGCSGLISVAVPNSVARIEDGAFFGTPWYNNQSDGVVYINNVLYNYKGAMPSGTSVEIIEGTVSISPNAFQDCSDLVSVTIPNSVTSIEEYAFDGCSGLTSVVIPNSVTNIGHFAFRNCSVMALVTISSNVKSIGDGVFRGCSGLTSVTIPDSVTYIGYGAFDGCSGLVSLTIGNSVTSIGSYAFSGCAGLTSVTIPNSVMSIDPSAFRNCTGLTSVTIGNSVASIGDNAFVDSKLRTVVSLNPEPPTGSGISSTYTYNHATLYVPEDSYWAYAYTKGWGEFVHMKEIAISDEVLASSKAYMIADAKGCNYTVYDAGRDKLVNVEYTFALDEENEGACWTVMKDGGESYLYNIGAKKFAAMNEDGKLSLSDTPVNLDIATTESGLSINGNARMFVLNDKVDVDVTAINGITADGIDDADAPVYNLQGMKMRNADNLPKGIYIINGKKYLVK